MIILPTEEKSFGPARVCILGESGAGKTLLAATFPNPLFLDLENGAGSTNAPRINIPPSPNANAQIKSVIANLKNSELVDGALLYKDNNGDKDITIKVRTLVIDSIDAFQENEKYFGILKGKTRMSMQDWGDLYNMVFPYVLQWQALPIHVVVTSHVKQYEGDNGVPGVKTFSLQGSFKDTFPRWFDYVLHIVSGKEGVRTIITQPMISNNYKFYAKDRHNLFREVTEGKGYMVSEHVNGVPTSEQANLITKYHLVKWDTSKS